MRTETQIQRRALRILREVGIAAPPVSALKVARALGADVRPEFAEDGISGALYREEDRAVIGVNASHHSNRQRFTIAHEIGHLVLHEGAVFIDRAYNSALPGKEAPAFLRDGLSSEAVDPIEIEANRFAACLLMPLSFLLNDLKGKPLPLTADTVDQLSKQYRVSVQAMTYRLANFDVPFDLGF